MDLQFVIIGAGRIAAKHAELIAKFGRLVAVCDLVKHKAEALAGQFGAVVYEDYRQMLNSHPETDIAVVATPNGLHAIHSIAALELGMHVLCEKPMALTADDCRKMIVAAEKSSAKLFIVKQNRFNPPVAAVKRVLDENRLGRILSFQLNCFWNRTAAYYENDWKGTRSLDGGVLFTQFSHFIDLMYWMLGDVKKTYAIVQNAIHPGIEIEDQGAVLIEMENNAIGTMNYTINSYGKNMEGSFSIFGENGTVKIGGEYLNTLEYQQFAGYEITEIAESRPPNDYGFYTGSMSNHEKVYENIIAVLNKNKTELATAFEGLKTVEIIERIYNSAILHNHVGLENKSIITES